MSVGKQQPMIPMHIEQLSFRYPGATREVLSHINLQLRAAELTVLIGPSGSGKTSLLRCMAGLLLADHSSLRNSAQTSPQNNSELRQWRKDCAYIPQDHALVPHKDALWHVCCGALADYGKLRSLAWWRKADVKRALDILQQVGLADRALDPVQYLSGGQQQRIAIARALMQEPQIILADEAVASLDPETAEHVIALLRASCNEERACLMSMHQIDLALKFADRIIALKDGCILHDGPPIDFTPALQAEIFNQHSADDFKQTTNQGKTELCSTN